MGLMLTTLKPRGAVLTVGEPLGVLVQVSERGFSLPNQYRSYVGGAELNTAIGLARLGVDVSFSAVVGEDSFGSRIGKALKAEGVDIQDLQVAHTGATGVYFKEQQGLQGATAVYYYRSQAPMALGLWDTNFILQKMIQGDWTWLHVTGIVCMISSLAAEQVERVLQTAKSADVEISFDVNVRQKLGPISDWQRRVRSVLPYLDWFILGHEEAAVLYGTDDPVDIESRLRASGFQGSGIILKRGAEGAESCTNSERLVVHAWPVENVLDPVGAGDGFNAGWIAGMVSGLPLSQALKLGAIVGARAVTSVGDYDGYPTWEEVLQLNQRKDALR